MVRSQAKLTAQRRYAVTHALQSPPATRQAIGQTNAVIAQIEQRQRNSVTFANT